MQEIERCEVSEFCSHWLIKGIRWELREDKERIFNKCDGVWKRISADEVQPEVDWQIKCFDSWADPPQCDDR